MLLLGVSKHNYSIEGIKMNNWTTRAKWAIDVTGSNPRTDRIRAYLIKRICSCSWCGKLVKHYDLINISEHSTGTIRYKGWIIYHVYPNTSESCWETERKVHGEYIFLRAPTAKKIKTRIDTKKI